MERTTSQRRRCCCQKSKKTDMEASTVARTANSRMPLLKRMKNVAQKTTIIAAIDMNRVKIPRTNFMGNSQRKSSSANRAVRIDKKVIIEHEEHTRDMGSNMENIMNETFLRTFGEPVPSLTPPGTVKAAAKATVAIRVATIMHDSAMWRRQLCSQMQDVIFILVRDKHQILD
ncbi:hypothetical protein EZV62_027674 [Acer yangbiense]|uniref:Uncharacterized protein n=1 Tax=Acer yangbiense TaxID=1000413 RepID=A0A5C7GUT1_9ROSI|nr:hypothetical protein EZV62_027674 [Acer yangbiense]